MERLRRGDRLRRRKEFLACYREGLRIHCDAAILYVLPRTDPGGGARLGITASRKVGKAVVRNRLKRRVREVFRRSSARSALGSVDIVVHCRRDAASLSESAMEADLARAFRRVAGRTRGSRGSRPRRGQREHAGS